MICLLLGLAMLARVGCYAQDDAHLAKLTEGIKRIRQANASREVLNQAVAEWSAAGSPKLTLMDDARRDQEHEFRGQDANRFKMNQVVTYVYSRQNTGMVAKGDYFSSTEKDICYSAIEKNVKGGQTASYTLTGHAGRQEFVFVAYHAQTRFTATVNGIPATAKGDGVMTVSLGRVEKDDAISISITNEGGANESFVILNHNPQK